MWIQNRLQKERKKKIVVVVVGVVGAGLVREKSLINVFFENGNIILLTPCLVVAHVDEDKNSWHVLQEWFQPPHLPVQPGLLLPGLRVPPPDEQQHPDTPGLGPHLQGAGVRPPLPAVPGGGGGSRSSSSCPLAPASTRPSK